MPETDVPSPPLAKLTNAVTPDGYEYEDLPAAQSMQALTLEPTVVLDLPATQLMQLG